MACNYFCKTAIVGSGIDVLLYAYQTAASVFLTRDLRPHPFEFLDDKEKYEHLGFDGHRACDLYDFLLFNLSLAGRVPMCGKVASVERSGDGELLVVAERGRELKVFAEEILFAEPEISKDKHTVLDWINVRRGQKHEFDYMETESDFVKQLYFYPTERVKGAEASGYKDVISISYLTSDQLLDYNYSEFIVRKKVRARMEEAGIRGPKNGKDPANPLKQKYYCIRLESGKREVKPLVISKPELPTISSTWRGVYLSRDSRLTSDFNGTMD